MHFGILMTNTTVIHFMTPQNRSSKAILANSSYQDFVKDSLWEKVKSGIRGGVNLQTLKLFTMFQLRAATVRSEYAPVLCDNSRKELTHKTTISCYNCEYFVRYCVTGVKNSSQVRAMWWAALVISLTAVVFPIIPANRLNDIYLVSQILQIIIFLANRTFMPGWMRFFTMFLPAQLIGLVFVPTAVFTIMNFIPHAMGWTLRGDLPEFERTAYNFLVSSTLIGIVYKIRDWYNGGDHFGRWIPL